MIILTELGHDGKPIEAHGTAVSHSTRLDTRANREALESLMQTYAIREPTKTFAVVKQTYQILKRTGEPQHPCG